MRYKSVLLLGFGLVGALASTSWAYLDPGTGSYVFQMIVAGLLGAAFAVKMFWVRIRAFFVRLFSRTSSHD